MPLEKEEIVDPDAGLVDAACVIIIFICSITTVEHNPSAIIWIKVLRPGDLEKQACLLHLAWSTKMKRQKKKKRNPEHPKICSEKEREK
jgi:hypothetical protein